jgi:hypothetical protein
MCVLFLLNTSARMSHFYYDSATGGQAQFIKELN